MQVVNIAKTSMRQKALVMYVIIRISLVLINVIPIWAKLYLFDNKKYSGENIRSIVSNYKI